MKARYVVAVVLAVIGVSVAAYPSARNLAYDRQVAEQRSQFRAGDADSAYEDLYRFLVRENERLHSEGQAGLVDAFSYQVPGVDLSSYGLTDNRIGFVEIPAIGANLPIYLGATRENMAVGAVHLTQTSYPIGGTNTNAVIAAHRGGTLEMFRNVHKIALGDQIVITNFRERLLYEAREIRIISPDDINQVKIQDGRDLITLVSCNPLGRNYERYVLYAERVG